MLPVIRTHTEMCACVNPCVSLQAFAIEDIDEQKKEINKYVAIIVVAGVFAGAFTLSMVRRKTKGSFLSFSCIINPHECGYINLGVT